MGTEKGVAEKAISTLTRLGRFTASYADLSTGEDQSNKRSFDDAFPTQFSLLENSGLPAPPAVLDHTVVIPPVDVVAHIMPMTNSFPQMATMSPVVDTAHIQQRIEEERRRIESRNTVPIVPQGSFFDYASASSDQATSPSLLPLADNSMTQQRIDDEQRRIESHNVFFNVPPFGNGVSIGSLAPANTAPLAPPADPMQHRIEEEMRRIEQRNSVSHVSPSHSFDIGTMNHTSAFANVPQTSAFDPSLGTVGAGNAAWGLMAPPPPPPPMFIS